MDHLYVGTQSIMNKEFYGITIIPIDDSKIEQDELILLQINSGIPVFNYTTYNQIFIIIKDNDGT